MFSEPFETFELILVIFKKLKNLCQIPVFQEANTSDLFIPFLKGSLFICLSKMKKKREHNKSKNDWKAVAMVYCFTKCWVESKWQKEGKKSDKVLQTGRNECFVLHVNLFCSYGCSEEEKVHISFLRVKKRSYLFSINTSPSKREEKKNKFQCSGFFTCYHMHSLHMHKIFKGKSIKSALFSHKTKLCGYFCKKMCHMFCKVSLYELQN